MYTIEKGVLDSSSAFFHIPSNLSKSMFFYLKCAGHFYCDSNYSVDRKNHDSYLLMYIKAGEGTVWYNNKTLNVHTNDIVLLNCHRPHIYKTQKWETLWMHFNGNISDDYYQLLYNRFGCVISLQNSTLIPEYLISIIDTLSNKEIVNEPLISCNIQRMLARTYDDFFNITYRKWEKPNFILESITYIKSNYSKKLTLNEIATHSCMSPYYFSRIFKKETGYSPYEYITMIRLNHAKNLLKTTNLKIKDIAFSVGFNSETNFVTCFKDHSDITPSKFRTTSF